MCRCTSWPAAFSRHDPAGRPVVAVQGEEDLVVALDQFVPDAGCRGRTSARPRSTVVGVHEVVRGQDHRQSRVLPRSPGGPRRSPASEGRQSIASSSHCRPAARNTWYDVVAVRRRTAVRARSAGTAAARRRPQVRRIAALVVLARVDVVVAGQHAVRHPGADPALRTTGSACANSDGLRVLDHVAEVRGEDDVLDAALLDQVLEASRSAAPASPRSRSNRYCVSGTTASVNRGSSGIRSGALESSDSRQTLARSSGSAAGDPTAAPAPRTPACRIRRLLVPVELLAHRCLRAPTARCLTAPAHRPHSRAVQPTRPVNTRRTTR